jgi:hypothetical protein
MMFWQDLSKVLPTTIPVSEVKAKLDKPRTPGPDDWTDADLEAVEAGRGLVGDKATIEAIQAYIKGNTLCALSPLVSVLKIYRRSIQGRPKGNQQCNKGN